MKLALVTTPAEARSGIGDYTRALVRELGELCDIAVFVERGREGGDYLGRVTRAADQLLPREFDQVLYQLGNERQHAFMAPIVRALGGCVALHDWVLFDLACAAYPALQRGGWNGHALALREGGIEQARRYGRVWRERRNARSTRVAAPAADLIDAARGPLVAGWYEAEDGGRWSSDEAWLRLPAGAIARIRIACRAGAARRLIVLIDGEVACEHHFARGGGAFELVHDLRGTAGDLVQLAVDGVEVSGEQRARGDARRLGVFVEAIEVEVDGVARRVDLASPSNFPILTPSLSHARFELPLNRSIVRFGDTFVVHSEWMKRRILDDRNAPTPIGVVPHGAERHWRDEDRRLERERLRLPPQFRDEFLLTSFGGVQAHKRIDVVLRALALARRSRSDIRLALVGGVDREQLDAAQFAHRLGLDDAVVLTDHVAEELGRRYIHAGDLAVQLRGPSTGGTSGGVFQSLACGRGVIASDRNEQGELPDACVIKLAPGEGEVERLAALLVELHDSPQRRAELEAAARAFVDRECHWSVVAASYFDLLQRFPPPRTARKSLLWMRVREAVRTQGARG